MKQNFTLSAVLLLTIIDSPS